MYRAPPGVQQEEHRVVFNVVVLIIPWEQVIVLYAQDKNSTSSDVTSGALQIIN